MKTENLVLLLAIAFLAIVYIKLTNNPIVIAPKEPQGVKYIIYRVYEDDKLLYDIVLPDSSGYDLLTIQEVDSVLQGYELK